MWCGEVGVCSSASLLSSCASLLSPLSCAAVRLLLCSAQSCRTRRFSRGASVKEEAKEEPKEEAKEEESLKRKA